MHIVWLKGVIVIVTGDKSSDSGSSDGARKKVILHVLPADREDQEPQNYQEVYQVCTAGKCW